ncbi:MAG: Mov34/MPN/PAD-1 family protein [Candidatus Altiarchaeota archaeon]
MPGIREAALELVLGASRELYPREFIALLRGEGDLITEVLVIPASLYGEGFSQVRWSMVPLDKSIIGSVHSHPGANNNPSRADLRYFSKTGRIHLIVRQPANTIEDVACYDSYGNPLDLVVT